MAASYIPKLNTKNGPCESCQHRDCLESRGIAATVCHFCDKPIGYETSFYRDEGLYVHAVCLEDSVETGRVAAVR